MFIFAVVAGSEGTLRSKSSHAEIHPNPRTQLFMKIEVIAPNQF
jgi:hypothetical protein